MADENNKTPRTGPGRDPGQGEGQTGQDLHIFDKICPKQLKNILDKIHMRYGNALRRLSREE